jgi:hypothetical protein
LRPRKKITPMKISSGESQERSNVRIRAIGYIVGTTGSFNGALIYVGVHALVAVLSYLVLVGDIKRVELKPVGGRA